MATSSPPNFGELFRSRLFTPREKLMGIAFGSAINRRTLLKASLVAGGAVVVRPLVAGAQPPAFDTHATASSSEWRRTAVTAAR